MHNSDCELRKLINVIHVSAAHEVKCSHYELHAGQLTFSTVIGDLRLLFGLPSLAANGGQTMLLCDVEGRRMKTGQELFTASPSTFLLTTTEQKEADVIRVGKVALIYYICAENYAAAVSNAIHVH